jgi:hypothetical protein
MSCINAWQKPGFFIDPNTWHSAFKTAANTTAHRNENGAVTI